MNKYITNIFILLAVFISLFALFKIVNRIGIVGENVQSEKPMVICNPRNAPPNKQKCFWTAHIHAQVKIFSKGKELNIGFEQGELEKVHTHAQKNKLHWHGLITVDPKTKELKDLSSFRIDKIPADLNIYLPGKPRFVVNGKTEDGSYTWKDEDKIEIYYE